MPSYRAIIKHTRRTIEDLQVIFTAPTPEMARKMAVFIFGDLDKLLMAPTAEPKRRKRRGAE